MAFEINKVAVLGAGVMGAGIAAHFAGAGIPVVLLDIVPRELIAVEAKKGLTLENSIVRNRIAQAGKDGVTNPKAKIKMIYDRAFGDLIEVGNFDDNMDMLGECDLVIEVVVERLDIKQGLMEKINEFKKPGSIVSTNTSGVSINKIAENMPLEFRQNFLGTHFFNPPRYMRLFEVIPHQDTNPEVLEFIKEFGEKRLGKGLVTAKDTPNFIANRIGTYSSMAALKAMDKYGLSIPQVDEITGSVMGRPKTATFKTVDLVGIDVLFHVCNNLNTSIEDQEEAKLFKFPEVADLLMKSGRLGNKTKGGFYKKLKTDKGLQRLVWDIEKGEYVPVSIGKLPTVTKAKSRPMLAQKLNVLLYKEEKDSKFAWEVTKDLLLYTARKVPEIAEDFKAIDDAMVWGYNWEAGPFKMWDMIGVEKSINRMKEEGETIPQWIEDRIKSGKNKFYMPEEAVEPKYIDLKSPKYKVIKKNLGARLLDLGDGVACLEFKSMQNSLTEDVIDMMYYAVEEVEKNYKGLVIGNQSANFSVGANLLIIGMLASVGDHESIAEQITKLQYAHMGLKYCSKPVVAAPYGMTLGGGCEVTLHAHANTPHAETYMGLVEVGVGLIPAGGGTKEMLFRHVGPSPNQSSAELLAKLKKPFETIVQAKVSTSGFETRKLGFSDKSDTVVMNKDYLIDEAKSKVLQMSEEGFRKPVKRKVPVLGTTGIASFSSFIYTMQQGDFISEHDALIAKKVAHVLCGGNVPKGTMRSEEEILELEKDAFLSLLRERKTLARINYMLTKNKPLRN